MKKIWKAKKAAAAASALLVLLKTATVSAAEPSLVTGTRRLIADATKILTGFCAGITVIIALIWLFKMQVCDVEEKPKYKKALTTTITIGVLITTVSGVVTWVFGYYS